MLKGIQGKMQDAKHCFRKSTKGEGKEVSPGTEGHNANSHLLGEASHLAQVRIALLSGVLCREEEEEWVVGEKWVGPQCVLCNEG